MELLYLWIEDYNHIKQQGFNFSPKYHFFYNTEKEELEFTQNKNVISDGKQFFEEGITNVTAIIGENGVGKTSIFSFIHQLGLINDKKGFILIYSSVIEDKSEIVDTKIHIDKYKCNIKFISDKKSSKKIKEGRIEEYDDTAKGENVFFTTPNNNSNGRKTFLGSENLASVIFYSTNIKYNYDNYLKVDDKHGLIDISTSYFLHKSFIQFSTIDQVKYYVVEEQLRQIRFYIHFQKKNKVNIPITLPDTLAIRLKPTYGESSYEDLSKKYESVFRYLNSSYVTINDPLNIAENIYKAIWANIISYLYFTDDKKVKKALSIDFKDFTKILNSIMQMTDNIKDALQRLFSHQDLINEQFFFNGKKAEFEKLSRFIEDKLQQKAWRIIGKQHIYIPLEDGIQLLEYSKQFDVFEFNWAMNNKLLDLSNGELQLLTFFSRIYDIEEKIAKESILFIDEGELGLHPQWQKQYLDILIETLPKIFLKKKIQLILTSHSPFIISDLPKNNVIFLRKGEKLKDGDDAEGKCIVEDSFREQTFAQNIHVLLSNSFFLKGGLIGDFAKKKINEIVEELNMAIENSDKEISTERIQEINNFIDMIGERLIKVQLNLMLDQAIKNKNTQNKEGGKRND